MRELITAGLQSGDCSLVSGTSQGACCRVTQRFAGTWTRCESALSNAHSAYTLTDLCLHKFSNSCLPLFSFAPCRYTAPTSEIDPTTAPPACKWILSRLSGATAAIVQVCIYGAGGGWRKGDSFAYIHAQLHTCIAVCVCKLEHHRHQGGPGEEGRRTDQEWVGMSLVGTSSRC